MAQLHQKLARVWAIGAAGTMALTFGLPAARAQTSPIVNGPVTVQLQRVATVATGTDGTPQDVVTANDSSGRLFVTTRNGRVRVLSGGTLQNTPFLDLSAAGISVYTGGEGGLLGMAFNPNYSAPSGTAGSGKFYTFDTEPFSTTGPAADFSHPELFPTTSSNPNNQIVVREWSVNSANPNAADPASSRVLMRINHPQSNHQGGSLRFGPDGNLYIGLGDGGSANDFSGSATSTTDGHTNSTGNGQDTTVPFGKILRIDVNATVRNSTNGQYAIPAGNLTATGALREIYTYGMRNPYRFSFDSVGGAMYVGDVGQGQREEVDRITSGGGNYGWPFREGTRDNSTDAGRTTPTGFTSITPIGEYTHGDGEAIVGGYVYRGRANAALSGKYIFGDLGGQSSNTIGRLFYMDPAGGTISALQIDPTGVVPSSNLYGFGQDQAGDVYAFFSNGDILRVVPEPGGLALVGLLAAPLLGRRPGRRGRGDGKWKCPTLPIE